MIRGALRPATKHRKPRAPKPRFDPAAALAMAIDILRQPPRYDRIRRVEPAGALVAQFILPLELAPTGNVYSERHKRVLGGIKNRCRKEILRQYGGRRPSAPLDGRALILATRFSPKEPDVTAAHSKVPVDCLCIDRPRRPHKMPERLWAQIKPRLPPKKLGLLVDDNPTAADVKEWWEPAPAGMGCELIRVYTGAL